MNCRRGKEGKYMKVCVCVCVCVCMYVLYCVVGGKRNWNGNGGQ